MGVGGNNGVAPNRRVMESTEELHTETRSDLVLDRYRLGRRLGAGGFGTVYAATDERLQRAVAVKVIPSGGSSDPTRAQREALAAGRLDHPAIVAIFDAGQDDQARYLVSELVHGRTVDDLTGEGLLSDRDVLRIGLALCGALAHAHERGVVHRDVKPQNVIVPDAPRSAAGVAKLADFGVAHLAGDEPLTRTGDVVGTLAYMAPEQAAGKRIDHRADLYSLALVLYEGLAGVNPVRAGSPSATARRIGTQLPPLKRHRKDLPGELTNAIDRALKPRPVDRGTIEELADELGASLNEVSDVGGTIARHPLEPTAPLPRGVGRAVAAVAAGALAAATLDWAQQPVLPALAAVAAVALFPRLGWIVTAVALAAVVSVQDSDAALVLAAALAPVPLLLYRHGTTWSAPALAPLLGAASLAPAYPALAGRAPTWPARAALGALGAWWWLLYDALDSGTDLQATVEQAAHDGTLLYLPVWAVAAALLPWIVRGRWLALDLVAASTWAAALGASTAAVHAPASSGLVLASVLAGVLAVAVPYLRRARVVEP